MGMRLGPGDAFVHEPGVQLVIALDAQARREEALAHEADLVLDLTFLPARRWRAGDGLDKMVRAHLEEAAIVLPVLADEDRLHRRLHVVVDAARAGVDGDLNPRLSGGAPKTGTNFAASSWRPESGAIDPCQRRKPPEAVAKGQRLQGSIAPQKSAAEIGGVAASHLLLPRIFSDQAGKPPDKRGFSPPATPRFHRD